MEYVIHEGKKYEIKDGILNLSGIWFKGISEIEGLERFRNLRELYLVSNKISEIKGLEKLKSLRVLRIREGLILQQF